MSNEIMPKTIVSEYKKFFDKNREAYCRAVNNARLGIGFEKNELGAFVRPKPFERVGS
jgi:hypothetical protein